MAYGTINLLTTISLSAWAQLLASSRCHASSEIKTTIVKIGSFIISSSHPPSLGKRAEPGF